MDGYGPILGALATAIIALLVLTVVESNVLLLVRGRLWEWGDRNGSVASAAEWMRGHAGEFAVADVIVRTIATALLLGGAVELAAVVAPREFAERPSAIAAATLLGAALVQAIIYLFMALTRSVPGTASLAAARIITYVFWPVAAPLLRLIRRPASRMSSYPDGDTETDERSREIDDWVDEVARTGSLDAPERQMVRGVLELGDTAAREVMVPRVDMVALAVDTPIEDVIRTAINSGFSRIPLYEGTLDRIVGIIYTKDLLALQQTPLGAPNLRQLARAPYIIPETKKIRDLLQDFRQSRVHMAIVVDEYGGTAGLVTIEDLLEEIVGEIEDEYDRRPQHEQIVRLSDDVALVDARLSIDDFNDFFHLSLDAGDYDTVGGFVYTHLGKIPSVGDRVPINGIVVSVEATTGRRITRLRVTRMPHTPVPSLPAGGTPP